MTTESNARAAGARRPGPALEAVCQFAPWLAPTVNDRRPGPALEAVYQSCRGWRRRSGGSRGASQRFLPGDRLQTTALDVLERLIEATCTRARRPHPAAANLGIEKLRGCCAGWQRTCGTSTRGATRTRRAPDSGGSRPRPSSAALRARGACPFFGSLTQRNEERHYRPDNFAGDGKASNLYKKAIRGIVAPGLVWAALTPPAAFGQSKLDDRVDRTLSEIGSARVLVMMTAPKLGEASSIAYSEPAGFVADLLGERGRNVRRIVDLPVVVVETDRRGIADLVDDPHVARVVADEPVPPLLETSLRTLHADAVHATGVLGHGYSVAVLDTGVDYDHPFFGGKLRAEGCFSTATSDVHSVRSLCGNGLDVDLTEGAGRNCDLPGCDHGTHVAGIAVGARISVDGDVLSGVAPSAGLMSIQVFTEFNDVRVCGANRVPCIRSFPSDQLRALRHVRDLSASHEIASVNMSFGGGYHDAACDSTNPLTGEILTLRESGIPAVVASGNDGYYNAVNSPACISAAVTVGASSRETDALDFSYSNTSAVVDFLAPGTGIVSAIPGGRYGRDTGTSMAAAHVAGLFALLRSRVPSASADGIESAVRATAQRTTDPRTGLVLHFPDARGALDALARSGEQEEPGAGEWSPEEVDAAFLAGVAGARRIVVQGGARAAAMPAGELVERIASALGPDVTVRPLGEGTFVAESRAGFRAESLSRLLAALGPDTGLYRDDPVSPSAVR